MKHGLDVQEDALRAGLDPRSAGWGGEPPEMWGRLGIGDDSRTIATIPGDYLSFYRTLEAALRGAGAPPVESTDAVSALRVIEASRQSAHSSAVVPLSA